MIYIPVCAAVCLALVDRGYDLRLGEAGRARLKKEISQRLKDSAELRDM